MKFNFTIQKQKQQKGYSKVSQAQKKDERKERQRPIDETNSKTTKELLGQLYDDKEYLEKLFDSMYYYLKANKLGEIDNEIDR